MRSRLGSDGNSLHALGLVPELQQRRLNLRNCCLGAAEQTYHVPRPSSHCQLLLISLSHAAEINLAMALHGPFWF